MDCRGGTFISPPCGEDDCETCGIGKDALRRKAEVDAAARLLFEDELQNGIDAIEKLVGAKHGTFHFEAAVSLFRRVDQEARSLLGDNWAGSYTKDPPAKFDKDTFDDIPF